MEFDKDKLMGWDGDSSIVVDWDYYFNLIGQAGRRTEDDLIFEMNQALTEAGVLCDFKPGVFGIIKDNMNASSFLPLNNRYYFSEIQLATGYFQAACKAGRMKNSRDFIFQVVE